MNNLVQGINCYKHDSDNSIVGFVKLFILLYADDTVKISESAVDLQTEKYETYCDS